MADNDGIVFSHILDRQAEGPFIGWKEVKEWNPEQGVLWLHLDYKNKEVQKWLSEESGIDPVLCEALIAEDTRPRVISLQNSLLLILRGINFNPGADPEDMVALRMWYDEHRIITMRHRKVMAIDDVHKALESGKGPATPAEFLVMVANRLVDRMADVVADIDDTVDELEETILTAESHELRSKLANVRRQSISLRRYMAPQRDVLARLQNERITWLSDIERGRIREVAERTARFIDDIDSARDRAAITQEELNNRLSEQMNKTMYILSIVAAVFLPLGLLTGLLGINVGGIPGTESKTAFTIVTLFLIGIAVVEVWIFKRRKWI
ncbi:MAG: zinc transporter ZntB [Nitrospiraceae bacterium]|nr:MAG: zinc transporter ZntB [Nitrospiraceae bacterium]